MSHPEMLRYLTTIFRVMFRINPALRDAHDVDPITLATVTAAKVGGAERVCSSLGGVEYLTLSLFLRCDRRLKNVTGITTACCRSMSSNCGTTRRNERVSVHVLCVFGARGRKRGNQMESGVAWHHRVFLFTHSPHRSSATQQLPAQTHPHVKLQ
jgi:hypothetical protein